MSHADRLARYFELIGPGNMVTMGEIYELFYRNDPDGGPIDLSNSIKQQIFRVKKKYGYEFECFRKVGYRMKGPKTCPVEPNAREAARNESCTGSPQSHVHQAVQAE